MIRFEKKPDPQLAPEKAEDKPLEQIRDAPAQEYQKPAVAGAKRRARQATEDDRLL